MINKKLVTLVSAGVLAIGLVGGGVYVAQANSASKAEQKQNDSDKELEKSVDSYLATVYTDKTYTDVKDNVEQKTIDDAKRFTANKLGREMTKTTRKKLYELVTAPQMVYVKNTIAGMYESEGVAKSTLSEKDFDKLSDLIKQLQDKKELFAKKETERLNVAKVSFTQAKDVEKQVNSFFDKEVVKDDVTREAYQTAFDKVNALKQVTLKEALTAKLVLVDTKLSEKEVAATVEADKVAQEAAVAVEAAKQEQAAQNQVANSSNGTATNNDTSNYNNSSNSNESTTNTPAYEQPAGGGGTSCTSCSKSTRTAI